MNLSDVEPGVSGEVEGSYRPNVGGILRRRDGHILLCERIDIPGTWQLPQGGVDPGETLEEALWRELGEELGLDAPRRTCRILDVGPALRYDFPADSRSQLSRRFRCQEQTLFLLEFTGTDDSFCLDADQRPEFSAFEGVFPRDALEKIWPPKRVVLERSLEVFSKHFA